jgi:hypothetical protein
MSKSKLMMIENEVLLQAAIAFWFA